jgi:predicted RNA-binding Zn-ribbon protein involved in translation (DUF1610 family)
MTAAAPLPHEWSQDALLNKAQRYADTMLEQDRDSWKFGFWSALTLEMLARAALTAISPTLIADNKDWNNIYFALGYPPNEKKFTPKSVDTAEVFRRLEKINAEFTHEMLNFTIAHLERRNSELHSGSLPFDALGTSKWLPIFYAACQVLLGMLDASLELLFGASEARAAETLIQALQDEAAKAVERTIKTHREVWEEKDDAEREALRKQASVISSRHLGHRVACPSCGSTGLVHGNPIGEPARSLDGETIVERETMLPSRFECPACGLKVAGYSKLNACGLGDTFTSATRYDAAEYFREESADESYGFEEDFNEY